MNLGATTAALFRGGAIAWVAVLGACVPARYQSRERLDPDPLALFYKTDSATVADAFAGAFQAENLPMEVSGPTLFKTRRIVESEATWRIIVHLSDNGSRILATVRLEVRTEAGLEFTPVIGTSAQRAVSDDDRRQEAERRRDCQGALRSCERILDRASEALAPFEYNP